MKKINSIITSINIAGIIIKWIFGILVVSIIVLISLHSHLSILSILGPVLLLLSVGLYFILNQLKTKSKSKIGLNNYYLRIVLVVIVLGISFGLYIRSFSPYPLTPGLDVFIHIYTIKSILSNSFSNVPLVYLPTFDIFVALGSSTFNADLNSVFWFGSILLCIIFSLSWYIMSYYFLRNHAISILGTIISLSITEMGIASNLQYYYPASFSMSIYPLLFFLVDYIWKKLKNDHIILAVILTISICSVLIMMHYYLGIIASVQLSLYIVCAFYIAKKDNSVLFVKNNNSFFIFSYSRILFRNYNLTILCLSNRK